MTECVILKRKHFNWKRSKYSWVLVIVITGTWCFFSEMLFNFINSLVIEYSHRICRQSLECQQLTEISETTKYVSITALLITAKLFAREPFFFRSWFEISSIEFTSFVLSFYSLRWGRIMKEKNSLTQSAYNFGNKC